MALLITAAGLTAEASHAQTTPPDTTQSTAPDITQAETSLPLADTLYQRARDLMAAGRYAEACVDFAESHRIDPATGGTLLNLAVCHEKLGLVATASAEFEQARALARHFNRPDREQLAAQHVALLRPRISTLSLAVHDATDAEIVKIDGVTLPKVAWTNLPIDPGEHAVAASAPGKLAWSAKVGIGLEHESRTIDVPALADVPPPPANPPPLALSPMAPLAPESRYSTQRIAGFALGAVGLATIGVGAAFGVGAISENSSSEQACPPAGHCSQAGANESQFALTDANVANVCIGAGIVALGVATVLLLTTRSSGPVTATAARSPSSLATSLIVGRSLGVGGAW
jgi:hypothetical protein